SGAAYFERWVRLQLSEHVLDAIEQVALVLLFFTRARFEFLGRQRLRELVEQESLFAREFPGRQHLDGREQVAASAARDVGHPLASQPQRRTGLRALGDLDRFLAIERPHLDLAAERQRREVDRDLTKKVDAVAPEELVLLDVNRDEEIAGGTAGGSAFAFTLHAELLACRDARRDLHL